MDKLARKELTKFSLLSFGISAIVVTAGLLAYHHLVIKETEEVEEEAKESK